MARPCGKTKLSLEAAVILLLLLLSPGVQSFSSTVPRFAGFQPTTGRSSPTHLISSITSDIEAPPQRRLRLPRPLGIHRSSEQKKVAQPSARDGVDDSSVIPSYRKLLVFGASTVAIWLSEPLLSLVDTTVVGLMSSGNRLLQLAAMGPSTTLMDLSLYCTYFLSLAVTSQLTSAVAVKNWRDCQTATSQALAVAVITGCLVTGVIWTCGPAMLASMVGSGSANAAAMTGLASKYCAIRAAVAPFSVLSMVAQAVCLSTHDVKTPVKAVAVASICNVVGDLLLRKSGLAGAATATALATLASCAVLMTSVIKKMNHWRTLERDECQQQEVVFSKDEVISIPDPDQIDLQFSLAYKNDTGATSLIFDEDTSLVQAETSHDDYLYPSSTLSSSDKEASMIFDVGEMIAQRDEIEMASVEAAQEVEQVGRQEQETKPVVPYMSLPDPRSFMRLFQLSLPLAFNMWAKYGCYFALTVKAADFGAVALASHNILMRVFFLLGTTADALGQTAQSFLPAALYPKKRHKDFNGILKRIGALAAAAAVFNFFASRSLLMNCGTLFTRDVGVLSCLRDTSIWSALVLALHPIVVAISGTVIATKSFANLVKVYAFTVATHVAILQRASSFAAVWQSLVIFQLVRLFHYLFWSKVAPNELVAP